MIKKLLKDKLFQIATVNLSLMIIVIATIIFCIELVKFLLISSLVIKISFIISFFGICYCIARYIYLLSNP